MRIVIGSILSILGVIILIFGGRQFGKYGVISKKFFKPKNTATGEKINRFSKILVRWVFGGILVCLGIAIILNKAFVSRILK